MKERPERKVNTDLTEPEKISIRKWCVEQAMKNANGIIDPNITNSANEIYQYVVNGNEQKL